uniref:Uncharacterized protein n=1 Tax=Anguilla anguilla TaxID=7936 RepID=A0A0E9UKK8_ANGAN
MCHAISEHCTMMTVPSLCRYTGSS